GGSKAPGAKVTTGVQSKSRRIFPRLPLHSRWRIQKWYQRLFWPPDHDLGCRDWNVASQASGSQVLQTEWPNSCFVLFAELRISPDFWHRWCFSTVEYPNGSQRSFGQA